MARALGYRWPNVKPKENDQYINDPPAKLAITIKVKALNLIHLGCVRIKNDQIGWPLSAQLIVTEVLT